MASSAPITDSGGYEGKLSDDHATLLAQYGAFGRFATQNVSSFQVGVDPDVGTARGVIVTPAPSGTGVAFGDWVTDRITAPARLSFASVPTGQTRFGAVVINRNWSLRRSELRAVDATGPSTVPVVPDGLPATPGVESTQVLYLARIVGGSANVAELLDRRTFVEFTRNVQALRPTTNTFGSAAGYQGELVTLDAAAAGGSAGVGAYLPAGQYLLKGTAILTASAVVDGNIDLLVTASDGGTQDLLSQPASLTSLFKTTHHIERPYVHLGGRMTVHFTGYFPNVNTTVLANSSLTASWTGPLS